MSQPQPATPAGGAFSIDLDRAPQAIRDLEAARDQMRDLRSQAIRLGHVTPPAADPVSRDAAIALGAVANGGPGSLMDFLETGVAHLTSLIEQMKKELELYSQTEEGNSATLS